jgi:uncharacterized protein (TIGR02996 family)
MSVEKRALLAAIGSNPDEDTPRLVFADWCDEHNEPERASFIRLQFEARRHGEDTLERRDIEERAGEILEAHYRKWLADEPVWARCPLLKFRTLWAAGLYGIRNGFAEHINLTFDDCLAHSTELFATAPIRDLRIEKIPDGGRAFASTILPGRVSAATLEFSITPPHWDSVLSSPLIRGLRKLSLHLYGERHGSPVGRGGITCDERCVLDDDGAIALAGCANLSTLNSLTLGSGNIGPAGMEALVSSPHLSGLESLSLRGHPVGDEGLIHLSRSPLASRLTELDLMCTQVREEGLLAFLAACPSRLRRIHLGAYERALVTGNGLNALVGCESLTGLTDLFLSGVPLTPEHVRCLATNPCFASLRHLRFAMSRFDDPMAEELAASPHLRNLRSIDLQNNHVGVRGITALARSAVLDTVTSLELFNNNGIADAGIVALAGSEHVGKLRRLSLVSTGLGLEGLRAIANSRHLAQLRSLDVQSSRFGDAGARVLCDSPYLQRIKQLTVYNCDIGDQMATALQKRFGPAVALSPARS